MRLIMQLLFFVRRMRIKYPKGKDAIHERLTKAQAITSCLLANSGGETELPYMCIYGAIWAVNSYLEEIDCLFGKLN